jgi:replicative DNA helicase
VTGYKDLDEVLCLGRGDLAILAARPGMGKSSLALNIAENVAARGEVVLFASLEMPRQQLMDRIVSRRTGIPVASLRSGPLNREDFEKINRALEGIHDLSLSFYDKGGATVFDIIREARRAKRKNDLRLIVIDYMQLIGSERGNRRNRNDEIEEISRALKSVAKELGVTVLALSQLNRQCEQRPDPHKRPILADLRDSGAIEQDADCVIFIYRPEIYGEKDDNGFDQRGLAEIRVAKNRQGPLCNVALRWCGETTSFLKNA